MTDTPQPVSMRLYAIVMRLSTLRRGAVAADHGDQARACLLDLIRRADAELAAQLHDTNTHKPYTISLLQPVQNGKRGSDGALHFGEGDQVDWRFTLLCEPPFEAVLKRFLLSRNLPHLRIGTVEFAIIDVFASGKGHPGSGFTTPADLYARHDHAPEIFPRSFEMAFTSPTAFHLGRDTETARYRYCTLPQPRLLFSTLRKKWAGMGGVEPGDSFDEWVAYSIDAEANALNTFTVRVENRVLRGFTGFVRFRLQGDPRWWPLANLLGALTFWTGVGYQTTRGMGQAHLLEAPEFEPNSAPTPNSG